jgi:hypothetical protein
LSSTRPANHHRVQAAGESAAQANNRVFEQHKIEYQTLPSEVYPNTAAIAHLLPALDDPANFAAAVDLMIDAIRARAQANSG